jgi:hypothetical protein
MHNIFNIGEAEDVICITLVSIIESRWPQPLFRNKNSIQDHR